MNLVLNLILKYCVSSFAASRFPSVLHFPRKSLNPCIVREVGGSVSRLGERSRENLVFEKLQICQNFCNCHLFSQKSMREQI